MDIAALRRKRGKDTALPGDPYQNLLFVLLILWMLLPAAFLVIEVLVLKEARRVAGYFTAGDSTKLCAAYAKYFYILGVATVCAALEGVARVLPPWGEIRAAARRRPWNACLAFMLLWSTLSTLVSGNPVSRFWGLRYHNDGLGSYFIYAAIYICALLLARSDRRLTLLRLFSVMGFLCSVMIFWQIHETASNSVLNAVSGRAIFFNINHCAYYLTMSILCTAGLLLFDPVSQWKICYPLSFAVQLYALLLNDTLGAFLAVLLALPLLGVFWFRNGHREVLPVAVACSVFLLLTAVSVLGVLPASPGKGLLASVQQAEADVARLVDNPESAMGGGNSRVGLWLGALHQIAAHPFFGLGPDSQELASPTIRYIRAHNEYLQHGMLLGIPALAAYLAAIFSLLVHQWKRLKDVETSALIAAGAAAGYLISAFFGITIFYTTPFLFFLLGLSARCGSVQADEAGPPPADPRRDAAAQVGILLTVFLYGVLTAFLYRESTREFADFANQERAEIIGAEAYKTGIDMSETFWFDPVNRTLITTSDPPPTPYGRGTAVNGKTFMTSDAVGRGYDLEQDYRDCVLLIRADLVGQTPVETSAQSGQSGEGGGGEDSAPDGEQSHVEQSYEVSANWVQIVRNVTTP